MKTSYIKEKTVLRPDKLGRSSTPERQGRYSELTKTALAAQCRWNRSQVLSLLEIAGCSSHLFHLHLTINSNPLHVEYRFLKFTLPCKEPSMGQNTASSFPLSPLHGPVRACHLHLMIFGTTGFISDLVQTTNNKVIWLLAQSPP